MGTSSMAEDDDNAVWSATREARRYFRTTKCAMSQVSVVSASDAAFNICQTARSSICCLGAPPSHLFVHYAPETRCRRHLQCTASPRRNMCLPILDCAGRVVLLRAGSMRLGTHRGLRSQHDPLRMREDQVQCVPAGSYVGRTAARSKARDVLVLGDVGCQWHEHGLDSDCKFEEPAMNQLINDIFGDGYISLKCHGGNACTIRWSQASLCVHICKLLAVICLIHVTLSDLQNRTTLYGLRSAQPGLVSSSSSLPACSGTLADRTLGRLWEDSSPRERGSKTDGGTRSRVALLQQHLVLAALSHGMTTPSSADAPRILDNISGCVNPGQVMAIMGASGAGKSTLLDILARKYKLGMSAGATLVNGRIVKDSEFRSVAGFVDQEDTLMSTLTVYETVLYSALLRLPREMSEEGKKFRVLETLGELGILGIKDKRIGASGSEGSAAERRGVCLSRVSL
ncbi:ATP-binding cassette [Salix suchowensis]|nr:ATP-binding cassette [Salix suchowensis]